MTLLFAFRQISNLKQTMRKGWLRHGIEQPESVADHSYRMAVMGLLLAPQLGVDTDRLVQLLLVHDLAESDPDVGDITPFDGITREEKARREREVMEKLCAKLPNGERILALWNEYEDRKTPEAEVAHQIDNLEMALQAKEYERATGKTLSEFVEHAKVRITHPLLLNILDGAAGEI